MNKVRHKISRNNLRVQFDLSSREVAEIDALLSGTGETRAQYIRNALELYGIYIRMHQRGRRLVMENEQNPSERIILQIMGVDRYNPAK